MNAILIGFITLALLASPALAFQCPLLIKQVNEAVDNRLAGEDVAGSKARKLAKEAEVLHNEGKHAEAVAKAEEAAKAIRLELKKK